MAVPRNRHSNARKNSKHAHSALKMKSISGCRACHAPKLPHRACTSCGHYQGRDVLLLRRDEE